MLTETSCASAAALRTSPRRRRGARRSIGQSPTGRAVVDREIDPYRECLDLVIATRIPGAVVKTNRHVDSVMTVSSPIPPMRSKESTFGVDPFSPSRKLARKFIAEEQFALINSLCRSEPSSLSTISIFSRYLAANLPSSNHPTGTHRGSGATDRDERSPASHRFLAHRAPTGPRHTDRERC